MQRVNFTANRLALAKCEEGKHQALFWDGKTPGLGLRVTASGAKSFIFESRLNSRTVRLTIGDTRTWTIGKAQSEATRLKTLTDQGVDPRQQRRDSAALAEAARQEEQQKTLTVGEAWQNYIDTRKAKWGEYHLRNHLNMAKVGGEAHPNYRHGESTLSAKEEHRAVRADLRRLERLMEKWGIGSGPKLRG